MMMNTRTRILVMISSLVLLSGCGAKNDAGRGKSTEPLVKDVVVKKVAPVEVTDYHDVSGTVTSVNTSIVSAKVMGEVKDIKVKASDSVQTGDLLLTIHSPDIEARVQAANEAAGEAEKAMAMAEENRILMEKTFNRFEKLNNEKAVSVQEFDNIRAKRQMAVLDHERSKKTLQRTEAALREAEAFRDYTVIRSPVDGVIADKKIDVGTMTAPGMPLFEIEAPLYRVEAAVDEGLLPSLAADTAVEIFIDSLDLKTNGTVGEVVRSVDPSTRTFTIKIDLARNIPLLSGGLYAKVRLPAGKKSKLFINRDAVITRGELRGVYVVSREKTITLRMIKTGKEHKGMIEVLSGLNADESIIVEGADRAVDGGRVL